MKKKQYPIVVRDASKIAKHAWRILPKKKRGHVVIVFNRHNVEDMGVDSGVDPKHVPTVLWHALVGIVGCAWVAQALAQKLARDAAVVKKKSGRKLSK